MTRRACVFWLVLAISASATAAEEFRLVALDVGEGQAILLQYGTHGVLIDTGHPGQALHVMQRLRAYGVMHLDELILTHLHPDHAGGYFRLREAFPKVPVVYNGQPLPRDIAPEMTRWVNDALQRDERRRVVRAGAQWAWEGMRLRVLWPDEFVSDDLNRHSLVLSIEYGKSRVLIMGDAGLDVERALLAGAALPSAVQVLVAGHHAAADTGGRGFLRHVKPQFALVSVNRDNIHGYPAPRTLETLREFGAQVLRTDVSGEICVVVAPDGVARLCAPR